VVRFLERSRESWPSCGSCCVSLRGHFNSFFRRNQPSDLRRERANSPNQPRWSRRYGGMRNFGRPNNRIENKKRSTNKNGRTRTLATARAARALAPEDDPATSIVR